MSERRQVWTTLATLLQRLERGETTVSPPSPDLTPITEELRKLGKTQFKTNTLTENQLTAVQTALTQLENSQTEQAALLDMVRQAQTAQANQRLLLAVLPALDGLEQAIASGKHYLQQRDKAARLPHLTPQQAQLVSPADRAMLAGWLDGLRLVQERLVAVLEAGGVRRIEAVKRPFDPFLHKAVGVVTTVDDDTILPNTIVSEAWPGYQTETGVLRFAEVIVYKPE